MKEREIWCEALGVSQLDYDSWSKETAPDQSVAAWALSHGKIDMNLYFKWAKSNYEIPVISDTFFLNSPDIKFYNSIKEVGAWSPGLVPLAQWEDVVYVGCVEPLLDFKWSFKVQFCLAKPECLEKVWNQYQGSQDSEQAAANFESSPPQESFSADSEETQLDGPEGFNFSEVELAAPDTPIEFDLDDSSQKNEDGPAGLNFDLGELPDSNENAFELEEISGTGNEELNLDIPKSDSSLEQPPIQSENISLQGLADAPVTSQQNSTSSTKAAPPPLASAPPVPPAIPQQPEVDAMEVIELGNSSVDRAPVLVEKEKIPGFESGSIAPDNQGAKTSDSATTEDEIYGWGFKELSQHFDKSMILLFQDENKIVPYKWTDNWSPKSAEAFEQVHLEEPSPFRIVQRTGRPYHGRLAPSNTMQTFFDSWGLESLPPHATLAPLKIGPQLIGLTLSVGSRPKDIKRSLFDAEKTADRITEKLKELTRSKAG